jgi:hypothetical protein
MPDKKYVRERRDHTFLKEAYDKEEMIIDKFGEQLKQVSHGGCGRGGGGGEI